MEHLRNNIGLIELNKVIKFRLFKTITKHCTFYYNGEKYYFKKAIDSELYNELIAYEIASDIGIQSVPYDIGIINDCKGVFCKGFDKEDHRLDHITECLLRTYDEYLATNNLEDIWWALINIFQDEKMVSNIMDKIVDTFLFDVLIGNNDRHSDNMMLDTSNSNICYTLIYDNTEMLSPHSLNKHRYALKIDENDYFGEEDLLYKFLSFSDFSYIDRLKSFLWAIERENIIDVFKRVEEKTKSTISLYQKEEILNKFEINRKSIQEVINQVEKANSKILKK